MYGALPTILITAIALAGCAAQPINPAVAEATQKRLAAVDELAAAIEHQVEGGEALTPSFMELYCSSFRLRAEAHLAAARGSERAAIAREYLKQCSDRYMLISGMHVGQDVTRVQRAIAAFYVCDAQLLLANIESDSFSADHSRPSFPVAPQLSNSTEASTLALRVVERASTADEVVRLLRDRQNNVTSSRAFEAILSSSLARHAFESDHRAAGTPAEQRAAAERYLSSAKQSLSYAKSWQEPNPVEVAIFQYELADAQFEIARLNVDR